MLNSDWQRPSVFAAADSTGGIQRCQDAMRALGVEHDIVHPVTHAVDALDERAPEVAIVDISEDLGDALDRLLDRLNLAAKTQRHRSVVRVVPELVDVAAARAPHRDVMLLCGVSTLEVVGALAVAAGPATAPTVRETGEESPTQLRRLSEEVSRIAKALAELSGAEIAFEHTPPVRPAMTPNGALPSAAAVRSLLRARRLREHYFEADLFADPAWDMLLDLLLARIERREVAVSSLCIAAAVPPTTALRWIKRLTDDGLFVRTADPRDGRRVFIDLSDAAASGLAGYFNAIERLGLRFS
jgi:hypothetical protein